MPLTGKGEKIESKMKSEYGSKEGEKVFYASRNAGTIKGVDAKERGADAGTFCAGGHVGGQHIKRRPTR